MASGTGSACARIAAVLVPAGWKRLRKAGLRLTFWIPLTPWPVLLWVQSHGTYSTGRHSAEALHPVHLHAELACLGTHLIALVLIAMCYREQDESAVPLWFLFAFINGCAMWGYVESHAVAYA